MNQSKNYLKAAVLILLGIFFLLNSTPYGAEYLENIRAQFNAISPFKSIWRTLLGIFLIYLGIRSLDGRERFSSCSCSYRRKKDRGPSVQVSEETLDDEGNIP